MISKFFFRKELSFAHGGVAVLLYLADRLGVGAFVGPERDPGDQPVLVGSDGLSAGLGGQFRTGGGRPSGFGGLTSKLSGASSRSQALTIHLFIVEMCDLE
jgi:hypothetical protein